MAEAPSPQDTHMKFESSDLPITFPWIGHWQVCRVTGATVLTECLNGTQGYTIFHNDRDMESPEYTHEV